MSLDSKLKDDACSIVNAVVTAYITSQSDKRQNTATEVVKHLTEQKAHT